MDTNKEYAELMEMKTNKVAKEIVHLLYKENLQPMAAIVSIIDLTRDRFLTTIARKNAIK